MAKSKNNKNKKATPKAKATAKPAPKKVAKKPVAKKITKPVAKAKPVVKKVVKPAPKKATKPVVKKVAKPAPKKVFKPVPKKAVKPAPKKVAKPIAKKVIKPAPKKVAPKKAAKPVAKKAVAKPIAKKPAPKPVAKPIAKPVVKKVAAPAPKTAPVAKVVAKPLGAAKVGVKPNIKPTTKKPTKKGAKPTEMYDGKRVVRHELPAKALIIIPKHEEEITSDSPHYVYPTLRYSDKELKEFKDIIEKKLAGSREELTNLRDSLESHTDSQGGSKSWNMEEGSDSSEMEYLMNQISRLNKFIRDLEMALVRIENKTYGICRATGKLIDKQRLRVVPHATLSMEAKMNRKTDDIPNTSQTPAVHMGSEGESFGVEE